MNILVLNPGSTSTKISISDGEIELITESLLHSADEIAGYPRVFDQFQMRLHAINQFLETTASDPASLSAVIGRGGLLKPLTSGVYRVSEKIIEDLSAGTYGEHASNLGALLAFEIAKPIAIPAFIADPVVVDEMDDVARLSGLPELPRRSIFHALNQKSAAREAAVQIGREYEEINLIVAHMGGGCTVGAHRRGRVVDVNNGLDGEGPFSPERAGTVPAWQLVELALSGDFTRDELRKMLTGRGGLVAYCDTNSLLEVRERIEDGDAEAESVCQSMVYQISKEIAAHGATLRGDVDAIVLTGGMAQDTALVESISDRVGFLGQIIVIPGEREMLSLARAAHRVLKGTVVPKVY